MKERKFIVKANSESGSDGFESDSSGTSFRRFTTRSSRMLQEFNSQRLKQQELEEQRYQRKLVIGNAMKQSKDFVKEIADKELSAKKARVEKEMKAMREEKERERLANAKWFNQILSVSRDFAKQRQEKRVEERVSKLERKLKKSSSNHTSYTANSDDEKTSFEHRKKTRTTRKRFRTKKSSRK